MKGTIWFGFLAGGVGWDLWEELEECGGWGGGIGAGAQRRGAKYWTYATYRTDGLAGAACGRGRVRSRADYEHEYEDEKDEVDNDDDEDNECVGCAWILSRAESVGVMNQGGVGCGRA